MDTRDGLDTIEHKGRGLLVQALVGSGVLLLLIGGTLAYPYVTSRLAALPSTPAPLLPTITPTVPSPTLISVAPTNTPSSLPVSTTSMPAPGPSPTPTPALPTRIVIPDIGVDAPVVPVSWQTAEGDDSAQMAWEVPDMYAAGWHQTSAPLGVPGNTVLNGHNTTHGEVFRDLYTLKAGDTITVYSGNTPHTYGVGEILILPEGGQPIEVRVENARYILPTDDERLTLVTCHPYGSLRYRLIVIAHPQE